MSNRIIGRKLSMVSQFGLDELIVALDKNDTGRFRQILDGLKASERDEREFLTDSIIGEIPLFHYAIKTCGNNVEMITMLIDRGCDVNAPSVEGTPLQMACKIGNAELVQTLLDNGAQIISDDDYNLIWKENSPFYIASLLGHYDVVKTLMIHQPSTSRSEISDPLELVKEESVRSCLLYAGCMGGDLQIVKLWFSPGMNINHPKEFVTSFEDCENTTPLYAACAGDHYEVAKFLVEVGAILTRKICETFPSITAKILEYCVIEEDDEDIHISEDEDDLPKPLHKAVFSNKELGGFHMDWISPYTNSLVEIDIRNNQIEALPCSIPWTFPYLKILNVSGNRITKLLPPNTAIMCKRLEEIHLGNNRIEEVSYCLFQLPGLKHLNLSHNKLQYLVKTHHQQHDWKLMRHDSDSKSKQEWFLPHLSYLNVSHNELDMLPPDIKNCTAMAKLDASYNKLIAFPAAWNCKMTSLDVSHNELERFPVSAEQFWCGTLKCLKLDFNQLEEINESIVKLCTLTDLCASNNKISRLPSPEVWDCRQLYLLDLSHNQLTATSPIVESPSGVGSVIKFFKNQKRMSSTAVLYSREIPSTIDIPQCLAHCLHELNLSFNNLEVVPESICYLTSVELLDLSNNPIRMLPKELGRLHVCRHLCLDELHIENIPKEVLQDKDIYKRTKEIVSLLRNELRQSKPCYRMKLIVLGKKERGKTTLINLLGGKTESSHLSVGIRKSDIVIPNPAKKRGLSFRDDVKPSFIFNTWDLAGDEAYIATQQCFLTQNSIYFLVWDIWSLKDDIDKLGTWLYSIEARTPKSKVILVATNLDKNKTSTRNQDVQQIRNFVMERYGPDCDGFNQCRLELCYFAPVSCVTSEGVPELKKALYEIAEKMIDPKDRHNKLLGRSVPRSYLELEKIIIRKLKLLSDAGEPPFLTEQSYKNLFTEIPDNDIDDQEIVEVTKFLIETGSLLHYNDQLKGLNNLYFLDPTWLCEVLAKVLKIPSDSQLLRGGKIALSDVIDLYKTDSQYPFKFVEQYIQILQRFEIALAVDNDTRLFIPSQLSKNPGIELSAQREQGKKVRRLYQMSFIPSGLWNRLLSRIMSRLELLMMPDWTFKIGQSFIGSIIRGDALRRQASETSVGFHINKKDMIYWRDGMYLHHDKGYFVLESVRVPQPRGRLTQSGIMITVQSRDEDYSLMGMIVDEIDDLLFEHYPGLVDFDDFGQPRIQRFAICPVCYQENTMEPLDHFTVEHCSRIMLIQESITCKKGVKVPLAELVPELFMTELPKKFQINYDDIEVEDTQGNFLGVGVTGSVYKGKYGNIDVALKFYHGIPTPSEKEMLYSMDSGRATLSMKSSGGRSSENDDDDDDDDYEDTTKSEDKSKEYTNIASLTSSFDLDEVGSFKAWKAFGEMRQEVSLTSKLQHPCIISFIGITVRPKLLMALELAPFGSLRSVLNSKLSQKEPFNKYRDNDKIFDSIFSKDLTFKMVYQIAKGLEYLHKCCIVYRDLKSDNILVTSLDLSSPVNVKLSDYGISKLQCSGGNLGLVGTPGYQAPEIIDGLAYDEKVDIFSFSMVIHEILSGERPYVEYKNLAQITRAIKYESKRPSLQDYNIDCHFPLLEDLMVKCWNHSVQDRPSASQITSVMCMRSVHFLCQHKQFHTPDKLTHGDIDCAADISEGQKHLLWLWEGSNDDRCYHILNLSTCTYHAYREQLPGPLVTCMAKVGKEVWVGTEGKEIEVYKQQNFGHPRLTHRYPKLGAIPTSIFVLQDNKNCKNVFVTLHDGKVQVYSPVTKESVRRNIRVQSVVNETVQSGWYASKVLRLTKNSTNCFAHISCQNEVWFGCEKEIVVINTDTLLVESRIKIGSLFPEHCGNNIQSLVYSDNRVWCLLQGTANVIEFDVHLRRATHMYDCEEYQPLKMNLATYISNVDFQDSAEVDGPVFDYDAEKGSRPVTMDSNELAEWAESVLPEGGSSDDSDDEKTLSEKAVPHSSVSNTSPVLLKSSNTSKPPPLPVKPRTTSENRNSDNRDSDNLSIVPPPIPLRKKRDGDHTNTPPQNITDSPSRERRLFSMPSKMSSAEYLQDQENFSKFYTLPNNKRGYHSGNKFKVNSIIVVKDTLWIGRDFGDILVVNISHENKNLYEHGEVIAVLPDSRKDTAKVQCSIESLVSVGDLVVSFIKENLTKTNLVAWEAYGSAEVHRIQQYWLSVKAEESKLVKSKKLQKGSIAETDMDVIFN